MSAGFAPDISITANSTEDGNPAHLQADYRPIHTFTTDVHIVLFTALVIPNVPHMLSTWS